ncbi:MAG: hypothetical protein JST16_09790 [Bdellovibrionales bacterium]|nr:hypothetical protein [Bdellovibrionales bacterium]
MKTLTRVVLLGASLSSLEACNKADLTNNSGATTSADSPAESVTNGGTIDGSSSTNADPSYKLSTAAIIDMYSDSSCDALSGTTSQISSSYNRGLRGYIQVPKVGVSSSVFHDLDDFDNTTSTTLDSKIYLSQVNVPTRAFTAGFPKFDGTLIKGADGVTSLVEWFRIDLDGFVELPAGKPEGDYEFAMLADDGARLNLGYNHTEYAASIGQQETKMICGTQTVHMRPGETLPINLSYFQGPRYHIALVLLWRQASATSEPLCGQYGNNKWFDSSVTPSVPKPAYNQLVARGWSPVPVESLRIPDDEILNPCQSQHVRDIFNCTAETCSGVGI